MPAELITEKHSNFAQKHLNMHVFDVIYIIFRGGAPRISAKSAQIASSKCRKLSEKRTFVSDNSTF
jgi:hypothetical protein